MLPADAGRVQLAGHMEKVPDSEEAGTKILW